MSTILLIDDEADFVKVATRRLEQQGYEVLTASNGMTGLTVARSEHPSVILLDVMMPVMDGYEVLHRLKDDPATQDIPVIMLTAKGTEKEMVGSIEMGAVYHMVKPYHPDELLQEIRLAMERHAHRHGGEMGSFDRSSDGAAP